MPRGPPARSPAKGAVRRAPPRNATSLHQLVLRSRAAKGAHGWGDASPPPPVPCTRNGDMYHVIGHQVTTHKQKHKHRGLCGLVGGAVGMHARKRIMCVCVSLCRARTLLVLHGRVHICMGAVLVCVWGGGGVQDDHVSNKLDLQYWSGDTHMCALPSTGRPVVCTKKRVKLARPGPTASGGHPVCSSSSPVPTSPAVIIRHSPAFPGITTITLPSA